MSEDKRVQVTVYAHEKICIDPDWDYDANVILVILHVGRLPRHFDLTGWDDGWSRNSLARESVLQTRNRAIAIKELTATASSHELNIFPLFNVNKRGNPDWVSSENIREAVKHARVPLLMLSPEIFVGASLRFLLCE